MEHDELETPKHKVETGEAEEKKDDSHQSVLGFAGQASVTTSPAKSQIKSGTEEEEDFDLWGPVPWAAEDDPMMGEITRALRASAVGGEQTAKEGDVGAEEQPSIEQETKYHFLYNEEKLKNLGLVLGTATEGAEAEEYDRSYAEELAKGSKMTPEELIAEIMRLDEEILAELEQNTKAFEMMGSIAEKLRIGDSSKK